MDLEHLTDVELRYKLLENGFPNLPVTETTRNILIKKLKNHILNETNKRKRQNHNSFHKSFDNTVDQNYSYARTRPDKRSFLPSAKSSFAASPDDALQTRYIEHTSPYMSSVGMNNSIGGQASGRFSHISPPQSAQTQRLVSSSNMYAPPPILSSESEEEADSFNYSAQTSMRKNASLNRQSRFGNLSPIGGSLESNRPHYGVVSRLLSFRDTIHQKQEIPPQQHLTSKRGIATPGFRSVLAPRTFLANSISYLKEKCGFKHTVVPYALLCAFVLFFAVVVFMYMLISPDIANTINENNTHHIICEEGIDPKMAIVQPPECIERRRLAGVLSLTKELIRFLQKRAEQAFCVDHNQLLGVTATEFTRHVYEKGDYANTRRIMLDLQAAEHLIKLNPQWKIDTVNAEDNIKVPAISNQKTITPLPGNESSYVLLKPHLPLRCVLYNKMQRFFVVIGTGALIGTAGLIAYAIFCYIRSWKTNRVAAVERFTADIVNELLYRASLKDSECESEVIVNHLRDKLIPLNKRSSLLWSWNEALRVLEANDSRIQFGISMCNGEEFRTMKWVGDVPMDTRDRTTNTKQWGSPAFANANKIVNPPTPCLKIRHMFDASDIHDPNLKQTIENAILQKAGNRCNIVDIQIDRQSCCVYVRCASEADAGIVHNEINGWWFDKNLVSIKFLRLPRYLSRFPKSS